MNADTPTIVKDSPEITRQVEYLAKSIEELGFTTDTLVKRLTPVLSPLATPKDQDDQKAPTVSPLATSLRTDVYKIEAITTILRNLLDILEI